MSDIQRIAVLYAARYVRLFAGSAAPIVPAQNDILTQVNSTFVTLAMDAWQSDGCAVQSFDVALQVKGDSVWRTVENSVAGNVVSIMSILVVLFSHRQPFGFSPSRNYRLKNFAVLNHLFG